MSTGALARLRAAALALALLPAAASASAASIGLAEAAARLAGGGYVLMMRHASTEPGVGDPPQFRIGDCATQRNLSAEGRQEALATGRALAAAGIRFAQVRSSQWCRCAQTATLAFGAHEPWPVLNSFFGERSAGPQRAREVAEFARSVRPPDNAMLVTHQVNIQASLGTWTAPGEIVAGRWRDGEFVAEFRFFGVRR